MNLWTDIYTWVCANSQDFPGGERGVRNGLLVQCSLRWQKLFAVLFSQQLPLGAETDILPLSERSRYVRVYIDIDVYTYSCGWGKVVGAAGRTPCLVCC